MGVRIRITPQGCGAFGVLIFLGLWLAGIGGWIANIWKLIESLHDPITGMFIARIVGVPVVFLGAILGYF